MLRSLWSLDKFFRVGAGLATCYFLLDATEEVSLWLTCREKVKTATNSNLDLIREIGEPILPGRYWDSSLRTTHTAGTFCTAQYRFEATKARATSRSSWSSQRERAVSLATLDTGYSREKTCFTTLSDLGSGKS